MCTTTFLCLEGGLEDLAYAVPFKVLHGFMCMWLAQPELRDRFERCWQMAKIKFEALEPARRWRRVAGPLAATIVTLLDLGWLPVSSTLWQDGSGRQWEVSEAPFDLMVLRQAIAASVQSKLWQRAAGHYTAAGVEDGVDLVAASRLLRQLRSRSDHARAQLLVMIVSGGMWPLARCKEAGYHAVDLCPLCEQAPETIHHLCWNCPRIAAAGLASVEASRHLYAHACAQGMDQSAFWTRGILSKAVVACSPCPDAVRSCVWGVLSCAGD